MTTMTNSILPDDIFFKILQYLNPVDQVIFSKVCKRFNDLCFDPYVLRKIDFSRSLGTWDGPVKEFFQDKQRTQYITELNLNDSLIWKGKADVLERCIKRCHHLETLHVLHCGLSVHNLFQILQHAKKLTTLSWSVKVPTVDIQLIKRYAASDSQGTFLENIKKLHLDIYESTSHLEFLYYLVLWHAKCLEELQVCLWEVPYKDTINSNLNLAGFKPHVTAKTANFLHLHSLTMVRVDAGPNSKKKRISEIEELLHMFLIELIKNRPNENKWKTFWVSPPVGTILPQMVGLIDPSMGNSEQLDSPNALSIGTSEKIAMLKKNYLLPTLEKMKANTTRKLELLNVSITEDEFRAMARVGGDVLQHLSLRNSECNSIQNDVRLEMLFCACSNITELNLGGCHFNTEDNLCKALSKLRHLIKIQLQECGIAGKHDVSTRPLEDEFYGLLKRRKVNTASNYHPPLSMVLENCKNIVEFDVRGCWLHESSGNPRLAGHSNCTEEDLIPIHKWTKLETLSCINLSKIRYWSFLKQVLELCKFLKTLRISSENYIQSYVTILKTAPFLKHLVIHHRHLDLASGTFWRSLCSATSLERICIAGADRGFLNVAAALEMLKNLPGLHVLHVHLDDPPNFKTFYEQMMKTLKKESPNRSSYFELVVSGLEESLCKSASNYKSPTNTRELCYITPTIALPKV